MDAMIRQAISVKKLLDFNYDGYHRIAEPHIYGRKDGKDGLLVFQIRGQSSSGKFGWKRMYLNEITNVTVLDETFPGKRPVSGSHSIWDKIYLIVS
jgi:hypothetical protein